MKRKNILEQVEEQEARRRDSERDEAIIKRIFFGVGIVFLVGIIVAGFYIYQYFQPTEEELAIKATQKKAQLIYNSRVTACENLIRKNLNYPSTYKMKSRDVGYLDAGVYVHISFTAQNAFGAELPQDGQCVDTENGMILIDIRNR